MLQNIWTAISSFLSQHKLADYIELFFVILIGLSSFYGALVSIKIEHGIKKMTDIQYYNKSRVKMAKELRECRIYLTDETIKIGLTNASKIQECVQKIKQYSKILDKNENKKLNEILALVRECEYNTSERTAILETINNFIAKLEKGDILI